jgi:hypothetical protein
VRGIAFLIEVEEWFREEWFREEWFRMGGPKEAA